MRILVLFSRKCERDAHYAKRLASDLTKVSISAITVKYDYDKEEDTWRREITNALKKSAFVIICVSRKGLMDEQLRREIFLATQSELGEKLIFLMREKCYYELKKYEETRAISSEVLDGTNYSVAFSRILRVIYQVYDETQPTSSKDRYLTSYGKIRDWGDAPLNQIFFGRRAELAKLKEWLYDLRTHLIAVVGIGGIGKTALVTQIAQDVQNRFDCIIWRSLKNAPLLQELLADVLEIVSRRRIAEIPDDPNRQIGLLLDYLRLYRCLIVLDNSETIMKGGSEVGGYLSGYENYGDLLKAVCMTTHNSCVIVTSREKPRELALFDNRGQDSIAKTLHLKGMEYLDAKEMLKNRGLIGNNVEWRNLVEKCGGIPFTLKVIAEHINDVFYGQIGKFLESGHVIVRDVRNLLNEQFNRLSELERHIVLWLAIYREPALANEIKSDIIYPCSDADLLDALEALRKRFLIELNEKGFTLPSVVAEYLIENLVSRVQEEIVTGRVALLNSHALVKAQSKEYIRSGQERIILHPLVERLRKLHSLEEIEEKLIKIISDAQRHYPRRPGYLAGNVINLLSHLGISLKGYNFSNLSIRQAYLRDIELHNVDFSCSIIKESVFRDTFSSISAVSFHPSGKFFAAGGFDGKVRMWEVETPKQIWNLERHDDWISSLCFSPSGKLLASASADKTTCVWDVENGEVIKILKGHTGRVRSIAFSPDGQYLVSGSEDNTVRIWDVQTGKCRIVMNKHTDRVKSVCFSPTGDLIASGGDDCTIKLWDAHSFNCIRELENPNWIRELNFSPDGNLLASGGDDGVVRIWNVEAGFCVKVLRGHRSKVWSTTFSHTGGRIVSGGNDGLIRVWDVETGECIQILQGHSSWVRVVRFSPDDSYIVSGGEDQTIRLWDSKTGQSLWMLRGYANRVFSVAFVPNSSILLAGLGDHKIHVWDIEKGEYMKALVGHTDQVWTIAVSPQGDKIASGSDDRSVRIWNLETGECLCNLKGHESWIGSVVFNPDGSLVASGSDDCTIRLWEVTSGRYIKTLRGHTGRVAALDFARNGYILASGSEDGTVKIWDVNSGVCEQTLTGHTSLVFSIAFNPINSDILVSGGGDSTIRVWNVETHQCIRVLLGHTGPIWSIAFNRNGRYLASASDDRTVRIWDMDTFECIKILEGHRRQVWSVDFDPLSLKVASGSEDQTIRLWDIRTGECTQIFQAPKPYQGLRIFGIDGLTDAQKQTLRELGAAN